MFDKIRRWAAARNLLQGSNPDRQMGKLVDDLRQTLDRDNGQADLERRSMNPLAVLQESLDEFRPRLAMAGLTLDTADLPQNDPGWRIQGDARRLEQVFSNLLENRLPHTLRSYRRIGQQHRSVGIRL